MCVCACVCVCVCMCVCAVVAILCALARYMHTRHDPMYLDDSYISVIMPHVPVGGEGHPKRGEDGS